ncbi:membrane cofactor protein-like [Mantella aurantiaca]
MERKCLSFVLWIVLLYSFINSVHCDCGKPPNIPYGRLKSEFADQMTFAVASTVKYDCQNGFVRIPGVKNYITCLENSNWSANDDFCHLRSCGFPGEIENGYLEAENFFFGSRVTYYCNLGYYMASKRSYRECQVDGTWSNSLPICEAVMCPPPPTIPNGTFHPVKEEYYFSDAVRYECNDPNMVMEYDSSVFCMDSGNWSDPHPSCIEVNCEPPNVPHSRKISGFVGPYTLNSLVRFECDKGFKMEGSDTIVCNMDNSWKPSPPDCIGAFCTEPKLLHGKVIGGKKFNGYKVDDSVILECGPYYKLKGANRITCGTDFQWNPIVPTCELGTFCPEPKLINGKITQGTKVYGYSKYDSIILSCGSGYRLKGPNRVTCQRNFQWSTFPICELKEGCSSPVIVNGRITHKDGLPFDPEIDSHGFSDSNDIEITCDIGYTLQGSSQSRCVYQRTWFYFTHEYVWSPELPTCQRNSYVKKYKYDED